MKSIVILVFGISIIGLGAQVTYAQAHLSILETYQQRLEKTPNDQNALTDLGELLVKMERYSDAESLYRRYLSSDDHPVSRFWNQMALGNVYFRQGKRSVALNTYRKAIAEFEPGRSTDVCYSSDLSMSLGSYSEQLVKQGFYDLAIALCRREESVFPPGISHANYIGEILLKQKKFDEALEEFKRAIKISPSNKEAQANLDATQRLINQR
jgi:tetratricopeptide (TPR) repeat protein